MSGLNARACALLLSVSVAALGGVAVVTSAHAQPAEISQPAKPKQIKRKRTGKPMAEAKLELADSARSSDDVRQMLEFIEASQRGLLR